MKYFRQFGIIMLVTCIAESVKYFIDLPIPASVYGLCIMMLCLFTKIVKLGAVEDTAIFLIEIMPVMFIPAGVGLLTSVNELKEMLLPVLVITPASTIVVMVISGRITQRLLGRKKK
ncbi:MAG: CidA/LrgA family protein [Catonella sp.]|uniref:CidA/LrgA family protein n=1 Tax=Catonella sp. TaxID=2382125 RepID=UPI003F9F8DE0